MKLFGDYAALKPNVLCIKCKHPLPVTFTVTITVTINILIPIQRATVNALQFY